MNIPRAVTAVRAVKVWPDRCVERPEHLATEEPLQILVAGPGDEPVPVAVTMRTPGSDFDLASGFLVSEGLIRPEQIKAVAYCDDPGIVTDAELRYNTVTVTLNEPVALPPGRPFAVSASCGACGKTTLDQIETDCAAVAASPPLDPKLIPTLPDRLRATQKTFDRTGGLHAAGLFDASGHLWCAREDVGRHNAVDKVIGYTVRHGGLPADLVPELPGWILMVSGRVSFEIIQKAAAARIGTVAAVSAPSSLAVSAAERMGIALLAFVRGDSFNVYSHGERLRLDQDL